MIRGWRPAVIAVFFICAFSAQLSAATVKNIRSDGSFDLDTNETVILAGITPSEEAISILNTIARNRHIDMSEAQPSGGKYIYVSTKEISLPYSLNTTPKEERVMINELLLSLGAARVDTHQEFERKNDFLEIETKAKLGGQGIWSYAETPK